MDTQEMPAYTLRPPTEDDDFPEVNTPEEEAAFIKNALEAAFRDIAEGRLFPVEELWDRVAANE